MNIINSPAWQSLITEQQRLAQFHLRQLFEQDTERSQRYQLSVAGINLDYSKNLIDDKIIEHLTALATNADIEAKREALFSGASVNQTERRPALHTLLRQPIEQIKQTQPKIANEVEQCFEQIEKLSDAIRNGQWLSATNKPIKKVINIGIGGSHLGPALVFDALAQKQTADVDVAFLVNADGSEFKQIINQCDPETTLFIITSKSFSTAETLLNAHYAKQFLGSDKACQQQIIAVTANQNKAIEFGINQNNILPMWDWVGGRYSVWSAAGISIAIAFGMESFRQFANGAYQMDQHFLQAPLKQNMPVLLALLSIWYSNFWHSQSEAVLPYAQGLSLLPQYLQQLVMESNGKSVNNLGHATGCPTSPVIWGGVGTIGQHAFHQLLHQGTRLIPADFIAIKQVQHDMQQHHHFLLANCIGQSAALAFGNTDDEIRQQLRNKQYTDNDIENLLPHYRIKGNKPSNLLLLDQFDAQTIGALLALYEHKTFVQACIWDINCFDQFGVELGKQIANDLLLGSNKSNHSADNFLLRMTLAQYQAVSEGQHYCSSN